MDAMDRAVSTGLRKYRELYPEGVIASEVENRAILSVDSEAEQVVVNLVYWLRDRTDPFYFFQVAVNKKTDEAVIITAKKPSELVSACLAEFNEEDVYIS